MDEIKAYITAMVNMMEQKCEMISTADVADHLNDLLSFVMDIPNAQVIELRYEEDGSDGMDEINRFLLS